MPFYEPTESILITSLADGESTLLDSVPTETDSGWDTLKNTYLLRDVAAGEDPAAAIAYRWLRGSLHEDGILFLFVTDRNCRCLARGLFRVEVTYKGMLTERGYKVSYNAAGSQQSGGPVSISGVTYPKVSVNESAVTAQYEYIYLGLTPPTDLAGTASEPPEDWVPGVRGTVWGSIVDATYHYPNGWVCEGVSAENLPGVNQIWLIRMGYIYVYAFSP